jgi:metallo-beta-lactamase class B
MPLRAAERYSTGPLRTPSASRRFLISASCVTLAAAVAGTAFHLVPMQTGTWRGIAHLPDAARIALALVLGIVVALATQRASWRSVRLLRFGTLAALPLVPVATGLAAALLFFQGPVLVVVFGTVVALMIARRRRRHRFEPGPVVLFVLALLVFLALGLRLPGAAGPQGDEPHYLLMARSLVSDGDVDLGNDFAQRAYAPFYAGVLEAHTSPRSPKGHLYTVHTPGLAALLAPGYAAAGYLGARIIMALIAAWASVLTYRLVADVIGDRGPAMAIWLGLVITAPFALYAVSIYPEMPAALATAVFLLTSRKDPTPGAIAASAIAAAILPWIHPKFLPLAFVGLGLTVVRHGPRAWRWAAVVAAFVSLAGLLWFFRSTYGVASLSAAYGTGYAADVSLLRAPRGLLGFALDRQHGLMFLSPFWLLAAPGAALLARHRPGDALRAGLLAGSTLVVGASFSMWWGGACPPGRFVVPALPALAVFVAAVAARRSEVTAGLLGVGAAILALAGYAPRALHNRGDGESAFLRFLSPSLDLDGRLPSMVMDHGPNLALAACLVIAVVIAWRFRWWGLGIAAAFYSLASASLATGPLVDARGATRQMLAQWWEPRLSIGGPPPTLTDLSLGLELPDGPWVLASGDLRQTRRFEVPPGTYKIQGVLRPESTKGPIQTEVKLFSADTLLSTATWRAGERADLDAVVDAASRRLQITVTGIQGRVRIDALRLIPQSLVNPSAGATTKPTAKPAPRFDTTTWKKTATPMRIVGPIHYVGTQELGAYLITTPAGHILLDGALAESAPDIEASIRTLGFKPEDIRILLISQAHFDHVGSLAHFKKTTRARLEVMTGDDEVLASGGKTDYLFANDTSAWFEPVRADRILRDGDSVALGSVTLKALRTAGHTPGTTTWTTTVMDGAKRYFVVFPGSTSVNPGTRLVRNPSYPGIADDFRRTFAVLLSLKPDIFLAAHASFFGLEAKRGRAATEGPAAFVDRPGYIEAIAGKKAAFEKLVAEEQGPGAVSGSPGRR